MQKRTCTPDFFVVGAPRAGTTTIYNILNDHPEIYMSPIKEPHYFAMEDISIELFRKKIKDNILKFNLEKYLSNKMYPFHRYYIKEWDQYLRLFSSCQNEKCAGESSPSYLWAEHASKKIKEKVPNAKIIIILRNPVDRAFSHYMIERKMGLAVNDFHSELLNDMSNPVRQWGAAPLYVELGLYFKQVSRYISDFGTGNVHICLFEDMKKDVVSFSSKLYEFLGVSSRSITNSGMHKNKSLWIRYQWMQQIATNTTIKRAVRFLANDSLKSKIKNIVYRSSDLPKIKNEDRQFLLPKFKDDILLLQELIKRDLSAWLK